MGNSEPFYLHHPAETAPSSSNNTKSGKQQQQQQQPYSFMLHHSNSYSNSSSNITPCDCDVYSSYELNRKKKRGGRHNNTNNRRAQSGNGSGVGFYLHDPTVRGKKGTVAAAASAAGQDNSDYLRTLFTDYSPAIVLTTANQDEDGHNNGYAYTNHDDGSSSKRLMCTRLACTVTHSKYKSNWTIVSSSFTALKNNTIVAMQVMNTRLSTKAIS